jgi:hypothetical protein
MNPDSYPLAGLHATGRAVFSDEDRGDPFEDFPEVRLHGQPFNRWLNGEVLEPTIRRWGEQSRGRSDLTSGVPGEFENASRRARIAFRAISQSRPAVSTQGLVAALGVTANLHRTLAILGEFMLGDNPEGVNEFALSRLWCGFMEYPKRARYFSLRVETPVDPRTLRSQRSDYGHLRNALRCSTREIEPLCQEALAALKARMRESDLFKPSDLHHLLSASIPPI